MTGVLRTDLSPEQLLLLEETFTPWDRMGRWPIWSYIDQRLDAKGLVAADWGTQYGSQVRNRPEVPYGELESEAATEAKLARLVFMLDLDAKDAGFHRPG